MADANDDALATSSDEEAASHSHAHAHRPAPVTGGSQGGASGDEEAGDGGELGGGAGGDAERGGQPDKYSSPSHINLLSAVPTVSLSPRRSGFGPLGGADDTARAPREVRGGSGGVWELCPGCSLRGCLLGSCLVVLVALLIVVVATSGIDKDDDAEELVDHSSKYFATGKSGAVAATNALAAKAGLETLEAGGNAVDAAAVVQFMLNVVQPESNGIGGGCMPLIYMRGEGTVHAFDGREEAPAAFSEDAFCKYPSCNESWRFWPERVTGGHPVGVPGTLAATALVLERFGTITLSQALQPAIKAAREGVPMTSHLHSRIIASMDRLKLFPASAALYLNEEGTGPKVGIGETWTNPDLASTFELIARDGTTAFYNGPIGEDIVSVVQNARNPTTGKAGLMTMDDVRGYRAVERTPVSVQYNGHTVYAQPPPTSGGLTSAIMLEMMDGLAVQGMVPGRLPALKTFIDTLNIAWGDRDHYMADADFYDVPRAGLVNVTYNEERRDRYMRVARAVPVPVPAGKPSGAPAFPPGAERRLESDGATRYTGHTHPTTDDGAAPFHTPRDTFHSVFGDWAADKEGTTHFSIVDKDRNLVSWTTTVEENLGSGVVVPGRGFVLNNELTDFDALPTYPGTSFKAANRPEGGKKPRRTALGSDASTVGGKRPRSSMNPLIVLDSLQRPVLALGSPGGATIIATTLNVLLNIVAHGMGIEEATAAPRVVTRNGDVVIMEHGLTTDYELMTRVHEIGIKVSADWGARPAGFVQTVRVAYARNADAVGSVEGCADARLDSAGAFAYSAGASGYGD